MSVQMGGVKLQQVTGQLIDVMRKAELQPDEVLNIVVNILARSAIITCMDKSDLMEALSMTYDAHLNEESGNETLN
jgi:hypothetical protein